MSNIANSIYACVFVKTPSSKVYEYDAQGNATGLAIENLTADEQRAWNVANEAATQLYIKYKFEMQVNLCAWDYGNNAVIAEQNKFFSLPAILVNAKYPNGSQAQYGLRKELNEKFFGINWSAADVYPYYEALYLQTASEKTQSLLCKIFPPLCNVGAYVWFAAMVASAYKAYDEQGKPLQQAAYGGLSLLAFEELQSKGGFDVIFKKKT